MSKNRKLNKFKEKFYSKYASNIQILKLAEYPNVIVKTKYGVHKVNRVSLLKGNFPTIQTAIDKFNYFVNQTIEIHNNKYLYFVFEYKNQRQKIEIICPEHGVFKQEIRFHLSGNGCKKCQYAKQSIEKSHTQEEFEKLAHKKHNNYYNYNKSGYINFRTKICITCPKHGDFWQFAAVHLSGHGCSKCGYESKADLMKNNPIGWTLTNWKNAGEKSKKFDSFKVYIIECWNENERFFKIGRTYTKTTDRFIRNGHNFPYQFKIIKEIIGEADFIFKLENTLKSNNKNFQYLPKIFFEGRRECFTKIINL